MIVNFRDKCPLSLFPFLMVLNSHSSNNFIVGGAVRDLILGKIPNDWDIVTDIPINMLIQLFTEGGFSVSLTGVSHLVLNVSLNHYNIEISNFRRDKKCDGRHAEVEIGSIEDDAKRRDFTVNALYLNTLSNEIIDPNHQGLKDIEDRVIRFIGNPKDRIREDYIRVFRFYRFTSKGFKADSKSLKAVREMFNEAYLHSTPERVRLEVEKMTLAFSK